MSDARVIHKKAGGGDRACALDHFEHRVWVQYILSADDYGVMRASESMVRADNRRLEAERPQKVQRALERVLSVGLVMAFINQGVRFFWQRDWQDFQGIRYPRMTVNPAPPTQELLTATRVTLKLFGDRADVIARQDYHQIVARLRSLAGAGGRETLPLTQTLASEDLSEREESARETQPPAWRQGPRPAPLVGNHSKCWDAPQACARGLCIPAFLGQQWRQQLGFDPVENDAEIRAFVNAEIAKLPPGAIGDDPLKFWRAAWSARHGSQAPAPAAMAGARENATAHTLRAAREVLTRERPTRGELDE
jgi:hypothetical protein